VHQWEYMTWRVNNGSFFLTLVIGDPANQKMYAELAFPDAIARVGDSGWELVTAMQAANTYTLIFKRLKDAERHETARVHGQPATPSGGTPAHPKPCLRACRAIRRVLNAVCSAFTARRLTGVARGAPA
jgi:hypothetical protein